MPEQADKVIQPIPALAALDKRRGLSCGRLGEQKVIKHPTASRHKRIDMTANFLIRWFDTASFQII